MLKFLFEQGHFHEADRDNFIVTRLMWQDVESIDFTSVIYRDAVRSYQRMHYLVEDGFFGPVSQARMEAESTCRCGCPDIMARRADLSEWPPACQRQITTSHTIKSLAYSGHGSIDEAWDYGITRWNLVSDILITRISSNAKIQAKASREKSGILAWSYLPSNNCDEVLKQVYNNRYEWKWRLLWSTICHEIGHAIGLSHGGQGIMQPANDSSITALGEWDIAQVIKRYGAVKGDPKLTNYGTASFL